ncbi:MAG: hypothetical protein HYX51_03330 [Chloroflexi bacterium]|nr:hypothetical protein [Chloroflexota bacterium]
MGLSSLGRERTRRGASIVALHIAGAAIGGAVTGAALGVVGEILSLASLRAGIVGLAAVVAFALAVFRRSRKLGLHCQVPRRWTQVMAATPLYLVWGALLGAGVVTVVPYSLFVLLMSVQMTGGLLLGSVTGAVFGGTREALVLAPLLQRATPEATFGLLPRLRRHSEWLNIIGTAAFGGICTAWAVGI